MSYTSPSRFSRVYASMVPAAQSQYPSLHRLIVLTNCLIARPRSRRPACRRSGSGSACLAAHRACLPLVAFRSSRFRTRAIRYHPNSPDASRVAVRKHPFNPAHSFRSHSPNFPMSCRSEASYTSLTPDSRNLLESVRSVVGRPIRRLRANLCVGNPTIFGRRPLKKCPLLLAQVPIFIGCSL